MTTESKVFTQKALIVASFLLSGYGTLFLFLFSHFGKHYRTPFTGFFIVTDIYWLVTMLLQVFFIVKVFFDKTVAAENKAAISEIVGPHFAINNALHFLWCYFFHKEKFALAELVLVINLLNLLALYFTHRTVAIKNVSDWLTVHFPVTALPLSWTMYAIFWNGACLFHSHNKSLLARILANVLVWEFLVVPLAILVFYQDWSIGLSTSLLMLGLGFGQLFTKVVALQWLFAFIIAAVNFVVSVVIMFGSGLRTVNREEQAPLLS
ncbi:hypothetical protein KL918_004992 [Ogataea parapolymorpha]|uniref:Uncharacterized protein n=1 Tax=Ogataea parapolymorpha (strain ATCC 26012 / BCRC 20466 / JCM 22074 / NRRL Y-7560 / DL-1) TaxID=871575 RepID=W1QF67_OGAPD|nr:hypothetical protein HPODL_01079 [Ogataea parapolymorpha DL-1]ESX00202.1 hypothetical protein HPODL_01079 [Ogataea parapolymorpha DL-1]KAG7865116.1 hypothetical protein KL918_004992 [Ogataea parapolymorpha]KAG7872198.1 hypothetical protein KL916_003221 [Ogataea parapolymorpha]KAG7876048.1 hypothetical protein KL938_004720 [Ogataea parapolymorpha]